MGYDPAAVTVHTSTHHHDAQFRSWFDTARPQDLLVLVYQSFEATPQKVDDTTPQAFRTRWLLRSSGVPTRAVDDAVTPLAHDPDTAAPRTPWTGPTKRRTVSTGPCHGHRIGHRRPRRHRGRPARRRHTRLARRHRAVRIRLDRHDRHTHVQAPRTRRRGHTGHIAAGHRRRPNRARHETCRTEGRPAGTPRLATARRRLRQQRPAGVRRRALTRTPTQTRRRRRDTTPTPLS